MVTTQDLRQAVKSAGGSDVEAYTLGGVSYCLTRGAVTWRSANGDGRGAWAVSQSWYPGTHDDLGGQAAQALRILRQRGLTARMGYASDAIAEVACLWWFPGGDVPPAFAQRVHEAASVYTSKKGVVRAGLSWWWALLAAGALCWLLKRKTK